MSSDLIPPSFNLPQNQSNVITAPTIASASIIKPSAAICFVTGTVQLKTIEPPFAGNHELVLIFTNVSPGTFLTTGNIKTAITPVPNTSTILYYEARSGKYYPASSSSDGGAGNPSAPDTSIQFNNGGSFGGSSALTFDSGTDLVKLISGAGLSFAGAKNPITLVGGDDTFGDTSIIFNNPTDAYVNLQFSQFTDIQFADAGFEFFNLNSGVTVFMDGTNFSIGQSLFIAQHAAQVNESLTVAQNLTIGETISALSFDYNNVVTTCVSALEEPTIGVGVLNIKIGTGYTQTTGPTPRGWGQDLSVQGPIALQPHALNGTVEVVNNYFNGTAIDSPIGGHWIVTGQTFGGHMDAVHLAATTFANDVGLGITGTSTGGNTGWNTGIQVGGSGSPWGETTSKIGTGIHIRDYTTNGIKIDNPSGSPTASISADGLISGGTIQATSNYKSTDGSTGTTTTITTASLVGKTITVKNGLITGFA